MGEARKPSVRTPPKPGEKFNYWTVLGSAGRDQRGKTVLDVRCVCGAEREVLMTELRAGKSTNCGCKRRHGYTRRGVLHRDADGSGPRLVYGAPATPGGTIVDEDVLAFMAERGVTRVLPGERALEPAETWGG